MSSEKSGQETTNLNNLKLKEITMQPIKTISEKSSIKPEKEEIQQLDLVKQSPNLNKEVLASMNLLSCMGRDLYNLMKGLNPQVNEGEERVKLLDIERVKAATDCGKQITSSMRMQLDILKFAKELSKEKEAKQ